MKSPWVNDKFNVEYKVGRDSKEWKLNSKHSTIEDARKSAVYVSDTPYWIGVRIVSGKGVIDEMSNAFYGASQKTIDEYIETGVKTWEK